MDASRPRLSGRAVGVRAQRAAADALAARLRASDPQVLAALAEVGVVRQAWLDDPTDGPPVALPRPFEVLSRAVAACADRMESAADRAEGTRPVDLTICFTDLVGFTAYTAGAGDGAAGALLARHYAAVGRIARRRDGRVVKRLGDGLLLCFADSVGAVRTSLELVAAPPAPLAVRAGVHRGPALVVGPQEVFGHAVNVAARVAEAAHSGEVLVTDEVCAALPEPLPGARFGRRRARRFKGVPERVGVRTVASA